VPRFGGPRRPTQGAKTTSEFGHSNVSPKNPPPKTKNRFPLGRLAGSEKKQTQWVGFLSSVPKFYWGPAFHFPSFSHVGWMFFNYGFFWGELASPKKKSHFRASPKSELVSGEGGRVTGHLSPNSLEKLGVKNRDSGPPPAGVPPKKHNDQCRGIFV